MPQALVDHSVVALADEQTALLCGGLTTQGIGGVSAQTATFYLAAARRFARWISAKATEGSRWWRMP